MAKVLIVLLVIAGALVFLTAELLGHPLLNEFYHSSISIVSIILATVALPVLWMNLGKRKPNLVRIVAGFQTTMIVLGWFAIQLPVLVRMKDGENITIQNSGAPPQTQYYLLIALVVGILIIFPSIAFLYKTFKFNNES